MNINRIIILTIISIHLLSIVCLFSSPFVWIWGSWEIAWRLGLSGVIGLLISEPIIEKFNREAQEEE